MCRLLHNHGAPLVLGDTPLVCLDRRLQLRTAVYNAGDDLVGLGLDELEKVLLKSHAVVPGKRVKGAGVQLDQAMKEEIQKVCCAASAVCRMRSRLARRRLSHAATR